MTRLRSRWWADPALAALRQARRRRWLDADGLSDAAYQAYVTALIGVAAAWGAVGVVGDAPLSGPAAHRFDLDGPAWAGVAIAAAVVLAVRSGRRGGPLAVEAADVHHVLLSPHDRGAALARPAGRLVAQAVVAGMALGALAGALVHQRLPGATVWSWMVPGAVLGAATGALLAGVALGAAGRWAPGWAWTGGAHALVAAAIVDLLGGPPSPTALLADIGWWPRHRPGAAQLGTAGVALALAVGAWAGIGGLSIEAARRRTALVGQLRFALARHDLRTVVVLRRELTAERHRSRPWISVGDGRWAERLPVIARDLQGLARWPAVRLGRLAVAAAVAGAAMAGVWADTTPLAVVAGVAAYLAALDALEPLAQEIDHPGRLRAVPQDPGAVLVRHLVLPVVVLGAVLALAGAAALALRPEPSLARVLAIMVGPAAAAAVAGAAVGIVAEPALDAASESLLLPEVAGPRLALRALGPPAIAVAGQAPLFVARRVADEGLDPVRDAATAAVPVVVVAGLAMAWVRYRARVHDAVGAGVGGSR